MPGIAFHQLTKHYGDVTALDGLTADVATGRITAFLGANGSGKTTSMRLLLGLSEPDSGHATIGGQRYVDMPHPTRSVGAVLDQGLVERDERVEEDRASTGDAPCRRDVEVPRIADDDGVEMLAPPPEEQPCLGQPDPQCGCESERPLVALPLPHVRMPLDHLHTGTA